MDLDAGDARRHVEVSLCECASGGDTLKRAESVNHEAHNSILYGTPDM